MPKIEFFSISKKPENVAFCSISRLQSGPNSGSSNSESRGPGAWSQGVRTERCSRSQKSAEQKAWFKSGLQLRVAGVDARRATPLDPRPPRWGLAGYCQLDLSHPAGVEGTNHVFGVPEGGWPLPRAAPSARNCGRCQQHLCPRSGRFCLFELPVSRICLDNLRSIGSGNGYLTQGPVTTSVLARGVLSV